MVALVLFPWLILFVILIDTAIARKCLMQQIPAEYWKQKQAGGELRVVTAGLVLLL
jgi:hypothetical protein